MVIKIYKKTIRKPTYKNTFIYIHTYPKPKKRTPTEALKPTSINIDEFEKAKWQKILGMNVMVG